METAPQARQGLDPIEAMSIERYDGGNRLVRPEFVQRDQMEAAALGESRQMQTFERGLLEFHVNISENERADLNQFWCGTDMQHACVGFRGPEDGLLKGA
ncbi:hypothetical protein [Rhodoligotrophos ferricapiens]|uniref:hypothetical protein n=1 Tax=Rhodoligotrophos ferricapiens TaxID=3069264 RepID=UPI00315D2215